MAVLLALTVFHLSPPHTAGAIAEGIILAVWPILWAIIGAIFAYNIGVATGNITRIKNMLAGISGDRRVQVLILAWAFSGFMEGAAGYGTAVAIPASILMALGFEPVFAAVICLIGNTAPTAFGAIGIPVITLAKVTDLHLAQIAPLVALQLTPLIIIIPFAMVRLTAEKGEGLKGVWGVTLVAGLSFAAVHYASARWLGPELPALFGGIASLLAIVGWLKLRGRQPAGSVSGLTPTHIGIRDGLVAWSPYGILFGLILATSTLNPVLNRLLEGVQTRLYLFHGPGATPAVIHWILSPGTLIILAALSGGWIQGASLPQMVGIFGRTIRQLWKSIVTVMGIVAVAKVMGYSGMIDNIATGLAQLTGGFYPLLAPALGALGTFVTGSDTSANILFGQVQKQTALQLGLSPGWLAAANTAGATAGKMISPQNIAIAATATGLTGREGLIFGRVLKACLVYILLLGLIVLGAPHPG